MPGCNEGTHPPTVCAVLFVAAGDSSIHPTEPRGGFHKGPEIAMVRNLAHLPFVALALLLHPVQAGAQPRSLSGYCIDFLGPGCTDRYVPFRGLTIDFCEETCTLTNPVNVRGLEATLYDMECAADYDSPMPGRVMVLSQTRWDGRQQMSFIDRHGTQPIVRCR
jgi:hypothetical protein